MVVVVVVVRGGYPAAGINFIVFPGDGTIRSAVGGCSLTSTSDVPKIEVARTENTRKAPRMRAILENKSSAIRIRVLIGARRMIMLGV